MRKYCVYAVWGWFFLTQSPLKPSSDAVILQKIGPFTTEAECRAEAAQFKDMVEAFGIPGVKMSKCIYEQEV